MMGFFCGEGDEVGFMSDLAEANNLMARQALAKVQELQNAIRRHRDFRGDDRCWMDDEELYKVLPEGYTPPERDTLVELHNCKRFIHCRHNPHTEYVSPQREIDSLRRNLIIDWIIILILLSVCASLLYQLYGP